MDAVISYQRLVHRESDLLVFTGYHLNRSGVATDHAWLLRGEPFRCRVGDARLAAIIGRVLRRKLLEQIAPSGIDKYCVALAQRHVVHLQSRLQILLRNHRARVQTGTSADEIRLQLARVLKHLHRVDDDAARRKGLDVLTTEALEIILRDVFTHRCLIVIAILYADMAEAVDMRADMALAEIGVFHIAQLVLAEFRVAFTE